MIERDAFHVEAWTSIHMLLVTHIKEGKSHARTNDDQYRSKAQGEQKYPVQPGKYTAQPKELKIRDPENYASIQIIEEYEDS